MQLDRVNRPDFCQIITLSIKSCLTVFERHWQRPKTVVLRHQRRIFSVFFGGYHSGLEIDTCGSQHPEDTLEVLHQQDPRVWRSLSPLWRIPPLLTPLPPSSKETQTRPPTKITRGIQHLPEYLDKWTSTEVATNSAESYTPPGSPPSYTPPGSPPFRLTKTTPRIYWRERV